MRLFVASLITFCSLSFAVANDCYLSEKNAVTKKIFTEQDYSLALEQWLSQEPESPGLLSLLFAYNVYKKESSTVSNIKGDKRKHCYIGCRITQSASYEAAIYAAWYKEYKDLTDCNKSTSFERRDYEYTLEGADIGTLNTEPSHCHDTCSSLPR